MQDIQLSPAEQNSKDYVEFKVDGLTQLSGCHYKLVGDQPLPPGVPADNYKIRFPVNIVDVICEKPFEDNNIQSIDSKLPPDAYLLSSKQQEDASTGPPHIVITQ